MDNVKGLMQMPGENIDMIAATSMLQQQAAEIRNKTINWASYMQSQMISQEDYNCIVRLDKSRAMHMHSDPTQSVRTIINLLSHVSKDSTIQYLLILIDDLLQEDRTCVDHFHNFAINRREYIWGPFLNLLNRQDGFIIHMSSRIIAKLACWGREKMPKSDLNFYLQFLKDQLTIQCKKYAKESTELAKSVATIVIYSNNHDHVQHSGHDPHHHNQGHGQSINESPNHHSSEQATKNNFILGNEYIQSVARCLQMILRVDDYRFAFVSVDGISTLIRILSSRVNFQVQYQLVFCLWVLTFNPLLATKMNKFSVIPILADILNDCAKEKVTRIILAVFRNLIEKPTDPQISKEHCIAMVQSKVLKQLSILEQRRFDDEDISADVEFLTVQLQNSVQDLSSFDEYATELRSARLEWSPVHKSAKFWRENAQRLNEKNYELLRILVHLLETSKDSLILSVACYDIGEYVRHYARGKHVLEQLGGKQIVMQLLGHDDPNVRYEALLAVQKLMVHNWEYLGKQLEKDNENQKPGTAPITGKA